MDMEKLKHLRNVRGMTYQQVAQASGISKEYYWMIENGKRRLSYPLAVRIAKVFETNPDEIFLNNELTSSEQKPNKAI